MAEMTVEEKENVENTQRMLASQFVYIHVAASSIMSLRNQMFAIEPNFDEDKVFYVKYDDLGNLLRSIADKGIHNDAVIGKRVSMALRMLLEMRGVLAYIDNGMFNVKEVRDKHELQDRSDLILPAETAWRNEKLGKSVNGFAKNEPVTR